MPTVKVRNLKNKEVGEVTLPDAVFGVELNEALIHSAVMNYQANGRAGTSATKTRGNVSGSGRKLWKQKGTGRARIASLRSPLWKGGGNVHGPQPRDWSYQMPKKMRRLAIRSVLSAKAADGSLRVVQDLPVDKPNTKALAGIIRALGFERSVLVVTGEADANVKASLRNLDRVRLQPATHLNVASMLQSQGLLMTVDAVRGAEALWGGDKAATKRQKVEA